MADPSIAFSPDGSQVVSGGGDAKLRIWDVETGELLHTMRGHKGNVRCAAYSPNGEIIVSGGDDRTARLWSAEGVGIIQLSGHIKPVRAAAFSPDGKFLATGGDHAIRIWRIEEA